MEGLLYVVVGILLARLWNKELPDFLHISHHSDQPTPLPDPHSTTTVVKFPEQTPGGLPPFPTGWKTAKGNPAIYSRAAQLLSTLAMGEHKIEQGADGKWIAYQKVKMGSKTGVVAFEPKEGTTSLAPAQA